MTYPVENLHREVAFIAYHFHWAHHDILALEHGQRIRYVQAINRINTRLSEG
ncbi:DUF6760 family protein [Streptomyces olivoreticuli]